MNDRPGWQELCGKVDAASAALQAGNKMIGVPEHLAGDLENVGIESQTEFWAVLPELLQELKRAGPAHCYRGSRPSPEPAGEPLVKGLKLWPFVWVSQKLGREVYLKFCLKESKSGITHYLHVRLHENRRAPRKRL